MSVFLVATQLALWRSMLLPQLLLRQLRHRPLRRLRPQVVPWLPLQATTRGRFSYQSLNVLHVAKPSMIGQSGRLSPWH